LVRFSGDGIQITDDDLRYASKGKNMSRTPISTDDEIVTI
jgi:hypothetical protein